MWLQGIAAWCFVFFSSHTYGLISSSVQPCSAVRTVGFILNSKQHSSHKRHQHVSVTRLLYSKNSKIDFNEDFYSVLEVSPGVLDERGLKKAYYKLVIQYHPDRNPTANEEEKESRNNQMMVINAAYKVLRDPQLRAEYDRKRKMGTYGGAAAVKEKPGAQNSAKSSRSSASASTQSSQSRDRGNGYSYTSQDRVDDEPVESFSDLFADIWKEVAMNKGSSLLEEALEFLESQDFGEASNYVDNLYSGIKENKYSTKDSGSYTNSKDSQDLDAVKKTVTVLKTTIKHTEDRLLTIVNKLAVERLLLASLSDRLKNKQDFSAAALEEKLEKDELVRSLETRKQTVQKQIKNLKRELDSSLALEFRLSAKSAGESKGGDRKTSSNKEQTSSYQSSQSSQASRSSQSSQSAQSSQSTQNVRASISSIVDSELQKLKDKMKKDANK